MSIELLKQEWTGRFVQVEDSPLELKRFTGLTGQVKTVSMNGQALVEFKGSEDIGWYDIHPQYLKIVTVETPAESTPDDKPSVAATTETPAAKPSAPADTSNLSPLELARLQDSEADAAVSETPATEAPAAAPETPAPADTSNLSPLELARLQDSEAATAVSETPATEAPAAAPEAPAQEAAPKASAPADTSNLSPLELARLQDGDGAAPAEETPAEETLAEETPAGDVEESADESAAAEAIPAVAATDIPASGPERVEAILAACRAQDGG